MIQRVLVANRGAIAVRIISTLKKLNIYSVAIYSNTDRNSLHWRDADKAICIGDGRVSDTYLNIQKILSIAEKEKIDAIHPGYGFLSENVEFVNACESCGIHFIGPTSEQIALFGLKHRARELAHQAGVPLVPGSDLLKSVQDAQIAAKKIGFPVMLKSTAGGGGIGMQLCKNKTDLDESFDTICRLSENNFASSDLFLEKAITKARHIEVQVFGDGKGNVVTLGERDCSSQRRNQKVIEEAPAPQLDNSLRQVLYTYAKKLTSKVNYRSAGTVEFIYDVDTKNAYFLEMNTRLQVEHGVTEAIFDIDLVEWMLKLAQGILPSLESLEPQLKSDGHAMQARIYAEDPNKNFLPSSGKLTRVMWPKHLHEQASIKSCWYREHTEVPLPRSRLDTWVESGIDVSPYYDPLIAKIIVHDESREKAMKQLDELLVKTELRGIETNVIYLSELLKESNFKKGDVHTQWLSHFIHTPNTVDVLQAGTQSSLQSYPGRVGFWHVGVPPSGPFDHIALQIGNRLLGNEMECLSLECTLTGPTLKFNCPTRCVLTGAHMEVSLNEKPVDYYKVFSINNGDILKLNAITGKGARTYISVQGGFDGESYLGSKATFTLGKFGGHAGRELLAGDVLHFAQKNNFNKYLTPKNNALTITNAWMDFFKPGDRVASERRWSIRVTYGPHGAPDFFKEAYIETFFSHDWEVHFHSSRTGIRLIGPKPDWARDDGGEAGLHPSNIHDNAYAPGSIDFTGDMPVILGPDGPSLGGFVCLASVIKADLWKLGQLVAGDLIRFTPISQVRARELAYEQDTQIETLSYFPDEAIDTPEKASPLLYTAYIGKDKTEVNYRLAADRYLLIEYGPMELDIAIRFRIHALMLKMQQQNWTDILELTPGIRSLQVHFDFLSVDLDSLIKKIIDLQQSDIHDVDNHVIQSRIVYLPLSWNDSACQIAVEKYVKAIRSDAPWCPDNIEFIRRINGLNSVEEVKEIVFKAKYVVMGLGDVYLGAPVATPLDPRHRLVTTKYNPARTWTAENSVGIGGSYLCVYGMEGPGGYQFVGRTTQIWNRRCEDAWNTTSINVEKSASLSTPETEIAVPWLLRFFDQIQFYPVSENELAEIREQVALGRYEFRTEAVEFSLKAYQTYLNENSDAIKSFKRQREVAFRAELNQWRKDGKLHFESDLHKPLNDELVLLNDGEEFIESPIAGTLWQWQVNEDEQVSKSALICVLEAMKTEIPVYTQSSGRVLRHLVPEGGSVRAGQPLLIIKSKFED